MNTERPSVSKKSILTASERIAKRVDGDADDIANCYYSHIDGYELAKRLENDHHWDIDISMIDDLDMLHHYVSDEHNKDLALWVVNDNITAPLKNGTAIKQGVIASVYEYGYAQFLVKENGCKDDSRHLIINFEDAVEV